MRPAGGTRGGWAQGCGREQRDRGPSSSPRALAPASGLSAPDPQPGAPYGGSRRISASGAASASGLRLPGAEARGAAAAALRELRKARGALRHGAPAVGVPSAVGDIGDSKWCEEKSWDPAGGVGNRALVCAMRLLRAFAQLQQAARAGRPAEAKGCGCAQGPRAGGTYPGSCPLGWLGATRPCAC